MVLVLFLFSFQLGFFVFINFFAFIFEIFSYFNLHDQIHFFFYIFLYSLCGSFFMWNSIQLPRITVQLELLDPNNSLFLNFLFCFQSIGNRCLMASIHQSFGKCWHFPESSHLVWRIAFWFVKRNLFTFDASFCIIQF